MPKALEEKLKREAHKRGYGEKRTNAYVYGTMNKLGILHDNHAGNLGPDKLLKNKGIASVKDGMNPNVNTGHIAIVVGVILVFWYFLRGGAIPNQMSASSVTQNFANPTLPSDPYPAIADYAGWVAYQYHPLGANAGSLYGESD